MGKTCKSACAKAHKRFNKTHFKPKTPANAPFINATELVYKTTCKKLCKPNLLRTPKRKSKPKGSKQNDSKPKGSKQKSSKQKGGNLGMLPIVVTNAINIMTYIPMQFVNSLYGIKALAYPIATIGHFAI